MKTYLIQYRDVTDPKNIDTGLDENRFSSVVNAINHLETKGFIEAVVGILWTRLTEKEHIHARIIEREEEQNKIVVCISVSSKSILDSSMMKKANMPRVTEFPGGIKEEEEETNRFRCVSCGEWFSKGEGCDGFGKNVCIYCAQASEESECWESEE